MKLNLPKYLTKKIMLGVSFLNERNETKEKIIERIEFLKTEKKYSDKEISYILLLLSLPMIDEFFSDPDNFKLAKEFTFGKVENRTIN